MPEKHGSGPETRKQMESALFALNLVGMVYLCFWAIRQDTPVKPDKLKD